jgi:hypothetical protein
MRNAVTPPRADAPVVVLPHFTRSILVQSLVTWMFVRTAAMAATVAAEDALYLAPSNPLWLSPFAALFVVAVVGAAGWVSARRRNEDTFLLCLGYGRARQMAMTVAPVVLLEAAIAVAMVMP